MVVVVFLRSLYFMTILNVWASHLTDILIFLKCHPFISLDSILREAARETLQINELYYITSCIKTNRWPLIIHTMNSKLLSLAWSLHSLAPVSSWPSLHRLLCPYSRQVFGFEKWQTSSSGAQLCWWAASQTAFPLIFRCSSDLNLRSNSKKNLSNYRFELGSLNQALPHLPALDLCLGTHVMSFNLRHQPHDCRNSYWCEHLSPIVENSWRVHRGTHYMSAE